MMTSLHLVRHGHHPLVDDVLCGRMSGVGLSPLGRAEMRDCASQLSGVTHIETSPRRRARESAEILADTLGVPTRISSQIDEMDMGGWTGLRFGTLREDPHWQRWNTHRDDASPPGGESMLTLQQRIVSHLEKLRQAHCAKASVVVTHAEPIRAAVLHYLGLPLREFARVKIAPAGIITLVFEAGVVRVCGGDEAS